MPWDKKQLDFGRPIVSCVQILYSLPMKHFLNSWLLSKVSSENTDQHMRNLRGTRGTSTPTFWTEGYRTATYSHFSMNRGDLRRLNYNKAALLDPRVGWGGILPPRSRPSHFWTQGRLVLLLNWYPTYQQSYAPADQQFLWYERSSLRYTKSTIKRVVATCNTGDS